MRIPFIAGNWKMNTTLPQAVALASEMKESLDRITRVEKVLCPPFISLATLKGLLDGTSIKLGAQNMYCAEKGAFTGEVSPAMLAGLCQYVILGHSERRHIFGEGDALINLKVKAAFSAGLRPILCLGETREERGKGKTEDVVTSQLRRALQGVSSLSGLVIAYEPVWAIGTGLPATGKDASAVVSLLRNTLSSLGFGSQGEETPILYGGSVTPENTAEFVSQPDIDGALVGGASLHPASFLSIVEQTARIKGKAGVK